MSAPYNTKLINPDFLKFKMGCRDEVVYENLNHKTRMCQNILRSGTCQFDSNCHYAHTYDELRIMDCAYGNSCIFVRYDNDSCVNDEDDRNKICYFRHPGETVHSYHVRIGNKKVKEPPAVAEREEDLTPKKVDIDVANENPWSTVGSHSREYKPSTDNKETQRSPPPSTNPYHILGSGPDTVREFSGEDRKKIDSYIQECIDKKVTDVCFRLNF